MEEEIKKEDVKTPTYLDEVRAERQAMEKLRDEMKAEAQRFQEIRAIEIMSGKTDAGTQMPKKELTPKEYKDAVLRGEIRGE